MDNGYLTTKELAQHFNVSAVTIRRWKEDGMPHISPSPGVLRFDKQECINWANRPIENGATQDA